MSRQKLKKLKRHILVELEWKGNRGKFVRADNSFGENDIFSFGNSPRNQLDFRFKVKDLEVVRDWRKNFFKDKVVNWKLEPVRDEISEKITFHWGTRVEATQYRVGSFLTIGFAFIALVSGVLVWLLWKKKRK